jgi:hypothetical protein
MIYGKKTPVFLGLLSLSLLVTAPVAGSEKPVRPINDQPVTLVGDIPGTGSGGILDIAHGQAFVDWKNAWGWFFCGSYLHEIRRNFALGGGTGLQVDYTGLSPLLSVNTIIGRKSEGLAFGADLRLLFSKSIEYPGNRIWITGGVYYRNFFVKAMPTFLFGWPEEWYFEAGYSFNLSK